MSGSTAFTNWINNVAKYVLVNGTEEDIIGTYFTSDPDGIPNCDDFMIKTTSGHYELSSDEIDADELHTRYNKK